MGSRPEDPVGFAGGDANLYAYVHNSPMTFVDPLGLWVGAHEGYNPCGTLGKRKDCGDDGFVAYGSLGGSISGPSGSRSSVPWLGPPAIIACGGCAAGAAHVAAQVAVAAAALGAAIIEMLKKVEIPDFDVSLAGEHRKLTPGEIKALEKKGHDPHELKKGYGKDAELFKDRNGNIVVLPKSGKGDAEPTGININDIMRR